MMLSQRGQNFLKLLHLFAVYAWVGSCFSLVTVWFFGPEAQSGEELFGMRKTHNFISVVMSGNIGFYCTLFTGLAYSVCTNRGFFRHKWIILKWIITLTCMMLGYLFFGPINTQLLEHVIRAGAGAPDEPQYQMLVAQYGRMALAEAALLVLATILSVYKPWEREELLRAAGKRRGRGRVADNDD